MTERVTVVKLDICGVEEAHAALCNGRRGLYYALTAGEEGRGRWEYRIPLSVKDFPVSSRRFLELGNVALELVPLGRRDLRGNELFVAVKAEEPAEGLLVLWRLSPGFRGGASYEVFGAARVLGEGFEAQGEAGRMGGAPCPVVLVTGPCTLKWKRTGRLYGSHPEWVAEFDGRSWIVVDQDKYVLEKELLSY